MLAILENDEAEEDVENDDAAEDVDGVGDGHPVERGDGEPAADVGLGPLEVRVAAGVTARGDLGGGPGREGGPDGECRVGARGDLPAADVIDWVVRGDVDGGEDRAAAVGAGQGDDAVRGGEPDGVCGGWLARGDGVRGVRVAAAATVAVGLGGGRGGVAGGGQLDEAEDEVGELSVDGEEGGLGVWKSVSETEEGEEGSEVEEEEDMVQAG